MVEILVVCDLRRHCGASSSAFPESIIFGIVYSFNSDTLQRYVDAMEHKGGASHIWGFIDGTMRVICRPRENQRQWNSGYKKYHAIKYQCIAIPERILLGHISFKDPSR